MTREARAEGSDSSVYPELSRVNLLRMRGDYPKAEAQALSILKRFPNNATAHVLLGDICMDRNDFPQALQWYELALDLTPDNVPAKQKLEEARKRVSVKETLDTAEQLGLPSTGSKGGLYIGAVLLCVAIIAVVAYVLGGKVQRKQDAKSAVTTPIRASDETAPIGDQAKPQQSLGMVGPEEDQQVLQSIASRGTEAGRIVGVVRDPRSNTIVITYSAPANENEKDLGAQIAKEALEAVPDAPIVTVRAMRKGALIFVADVPRSRYEETLTSSWQAQNADAPGALAEYLFINVWPQPGANEPGEASNQPPANAPPGQEQPTNEPAENQPSDQPIGNETVTGT